MKTLVHAGWLIDGTGGPIQSDCRLAIQNGIIQAVFGARSEARKKDDCVDLSACTVLPGLIDSHVHLFMSGTRDPRTRERQLNAGFAEMVPVIQAHLDAHLRSGVVAVRDGGDYGGHALRYQRECGQSPGPGGVVKAAGRAWRRSGRYGRLIGRPPGNGESLARAIARTPAPADHVKIVNAGLNSLKQFGRQTAPQFTASEMGPAVRAAHDRGQPVMVHTNGELPTRIAIQAGCDSVEHGFFMGEYNLKQMAEEGTFWVPTALTMRSYARALQQSDPGAAGIAWQNYRHQLAQMRRAREIGVLLALGTDAGSLGVDHGAAVAGEMEIFLEAGFSISQTVACACQHGARLLGLSKLGTLERGKSATFVAVNGPPSELPDSLKAIAGLWIDGQALGSGP